MKLLRAADHRRMPWKNGGGETTEIAVFPTDAGLDDFDWRVSMAQVNESGPFSTFDGVDRTLSILQGAGLILSVAGRNPIGLTADSEPLTFAADAPTHAQLIDGPILDLNVMTRRDRLTHSVSRVPIEGRMDMDAGTATWLLLVQSGSLRVTGEGVSVETGPLDAVVGQGEVFTIEGQGEIYIVEIADLPAC